MSSSVRALLVVAVVTALTSSRMAAAQEARGFAVDRFEPSERGSEWFTGESLDLRGAARPAAGVVTDYSHRLLVIHGRDGSIVRSPVRNMLFTHVGGSLVLRDRVRLSASLPVQAYADGHAGVAGGVRYPSPPDEQGVGDLRLGVDVRAFGVHGGVVTGAIGVQAWAPTGSTAQYTSDGALRVRPRAMVAGEIGPFVYAGRVEVTYRAREEHLGGAVLGSGAGFAASAGARLFDRRLVVGPELHGSTSFDGAFERASTPVEGLLGAHFLAAKALRIGAGAGTALSGGFGAPGFRALASVEWTPAPEAPPAPPPPPTPTPPPTPGEPGPDRDGDGVEDARDTCPDTPGLTASTPASGCPGDADGDGVDDVADACPTVPGRKTEDRRENGCPDPDPDQDGIPEADDACPDAAGPRDPDPKRSGCPKAFLRGDAIQLLDPVLFEGGTAVLERGAAGDAVLEAILKVLVDHPEIANVRVEGHTDDRGTPAGNQRLGAARAAAVVKWLVAHGIDEARLSSRGVGAERPVASNETEAGRRQNRRVELHVER